MNWKKTLKNLNQNWPLVNMSMKCWKTASKDAAKIRSSKEKLKGMRWTSPLLESGGKIYFNDSPCKYHKLIIIWKKCKSLQSNQFIHAFWVTNGTVPLKVPPCRLKKHWNWSLTYFKSIMKISHSDYL